MYGFLIFLLKIFVFPFVMIYLRFFSKERYQHIKQRLKYNNKIKKNKETKTILVHSVSVGETVACIPLVEYLLENYPKYEIVVSTVTTTGKEMVQKSFQDRVTHIYFPLDFPATCRRFLDIVNPSIVLIAETEIWPNFLFETYKKCIPVVLFNGRISPTSYKNYYYFRRFLKKYINLIDVIAVQSTEDKDRIINIGARKEKVFVMGNLKFESLLTKVDSAKYEKFSYSMALEKNRKVITAGSTHGVENDFVINSFLDIRKKIKDITLIIAPRHMKEIEYIENILKNNELSYVLKTEINPELPLECDVIILNTFGELQYAYSISDMAFVGGSIIKRGGHNILEALMFGIPVFFGEYMFNFEYIAQEALKYECGYIVSSEKELTAQITSFYDEYNKYTEIEEKCDVMIKNNLGALKNIISVVNKYL